MVAWETILMIFSEKSMRPLAPFLLLFAAACSSAGEGEGEVIVAPILTSAEAHDPWTFAEPEVARVTHVALDLELDFETRSVGGTATLDILAEPGVDTLVLDDDGLEIAGITDTEGAALPFEVGEEVADKGAPLTVKIGDARKIVVTYTAPGAEALQWLAPEQTAGGEHPYLLSQGQPTLNRTWIPTQDSPGIRQTWEARVIAPKPLTVVMSGLRAGEPEELDRNRRAFRFAMDKPIAIR